MDERKCLVVFYSRTGTTRSVAERIAALLGCETEEIADAKKRAGVLGSIGSGLDAFRKKTTEIGEPSNDPAAFDLVILGTPVWAGTMTPAVRSYVTQQREKLPEVAFFLTTGGSGIEGTFKQMQELCGKAPKATLGLKQKEVTKGDPAEAIRAFAEAVRS